MNYYIINLSLKNVNYFFEKYFLINQSLTDYIKNIITHDQN